MTRTTATAIGIAMLATLACSPKDPGGAATGSDKPEPEATSKDATPPADRPAPDGAAMKATTCGGAKDAIEARNFVGWTGLPDSCTPDELFGVAFSDDWGTRRLGSVTTPRRLLELDGYYRPTVSARDGKVVLFDAMTPELDGGWSALAADLGDPEAKLDWHFGTLAIQEGEWVYPDRGITVFLNKDATKALHIALYAPTTLDQYRASLRPNLQKKPRP